jgi:hypothetical protein
MAVAAHGGTKTRFRHRELARLMERAKAWAKEAPDLRPKYLATGAELESFSALAERRNERLSTTECEFVDASKAAHEAEEKRKVDEAARLKRQVFLSRMFAVAAAIALVVAGNFGWNWRLALANFEQSLAQAIDADIAGLSEQYTQGGLRRLVNIIQRRTRRPGAGLYLVTTPAGEPIAGNIAWLPPSILASTGLVKTDYQPASNERGKRWALVRVFVLAGGFHLVVGLDSEGGR